MDKKDSAINRFYKDFNAFENASHKYEKGEIDAGEYTGISKGFGDYLQRDNHQMLRIRVPGGRLTADMASAILDACTYYGVDTLKISTGQALQLHDLNPHAGRRLVLRLLDKGIVTRGSGGDNPNNITATPLSGLATEEYFDVQPYAKVADDYLLRYIGVRPLPRKFKIGFASFPSGEMHITMKDIGFLANPDHTFDVFAAGGLGIKPRIGVLVGSHVDPSEILYYLRTMLDVYMENGNYNNRNKARSRFLQETMGVDGFKSTFALHLQEVKAEGNLDLSVVEEQVAKTGVDPLPEDPRIIPQKQKGLCAVAYHPQGGYLSLGRLREIMDLARNWRETELRLTTTGGLYIVNCTGDEARSMLELTKDGCLSDFEQSISCVGHARCDIGPADSQKLLQNCLEAVRKEHFSPHTLPRMRISGCISSCAAQQIGLIGWRGAIRKDQDGNRVDAFFFSYGGSSVPGKEKLAESKIVLLAKDIPDFLVALGRIVEKEQVPFAKWLEGNEETLLELVKQYAV